MTSTLDLIRYAFVSLVSRNHMEKVVAIPSLVILNFDSQSWSLLGHHEMNSINPIRPGLFSRSPGPIEGGGGSEAQMPKIKVNINRFK